MTEFCSECGQSLPRNTTVSWGVWKLDTKLRTVAGKRGRLAAQETLALSMLIRAQGRPVPTDEFVLRLWGQREPSSPEGSLRVAMYEIRKFVSPLKIHVIYKDGYYLKEDGT